MMLFWPHDGPELMQSASYRISNMTIKCQCKLYFNNHIRLESQWFLKQEV